MKSICHRFAAVFLLFSLHDRKAALDYYEDKVLNDMNPFRKDDVLNQLVKVIKEDKEIGDKKRDELLDFYDKGQESRSLGEVFLYVVNRPNKPGEDFVGFEDAPLIAEANYECPICHKKLVDTVKISPLRDMWLHTYSLKDFQKIKQRNYPLYIRNQRIWSRQII